MGIRAAQAARRQDYESILNVELESFNSATAKQSVPVVRAGDRRRLKLMTG